MANGQPVVVMPIKSMGIAILLTVFFGPLGMFYSTVPGALIMLAVSIVVAFFTFGLGLLITWPASIVWGALATKSYNQKLLAGQQRA